MRLLLRPRESGTGTSGKWNDEETMLTQTSACRTLLLLHAEKGFLSAASFPVRLFSC